MQRLFAAGSVSLDTEVRKADQTEWQELKDTPLRQIMEQAANRSPAEAKLSRPPDLKRVGGLANWLVASAYFYAALMFYQQVVTGLVWLYVTGTFAPASEGYRSVLIVMSSIAPISGIVLFGTFISTAFAYGFFFSNCLHNLKEVGAPEATSSPMETWTWFFVPIAAWFQPFTVFKEVWDGSLGQADQDTNQRGLIISWWTCWLIANISSFFLNLYNRYASTAVNIEDFSAVQVFLELGYGVLFSVAAILLARIAPKVAGAQKYIRQNGGLSVFD